MDDLQSAPFTLQVFRDKPAMAITRRRFAAKKNRGDREDLFVELFFNLAASQEIQKAVLEVWPAFPILFKGIHDGKSAVAFGTVRSLEGFTKSEGQG